MKTGSGVVRALRVAPERLRAIGRVPQSGDVTPQCLKTLGCVVAATGIVIERLKTKTRIIHAGCEANEHAAPIGGVVAGQHAVQICCQHDG